MARKTHDVTVANGKYTDQSGQEKTRWLNVGAIIENERGNLTLVLNAIPAPSGGERPAWFMNVFPAKGQAQQQPQPAPEPAQGLSDDPEDIPF